MCRNMHLGDAIYIITFVFGSEGLRITLRFIADGLMVQDKLIQQRSCIVETPIILLGMKKHVMIRGRGF